MKKFFAAAAFLLLLTPLHEAAAAAVKSFYRQPLTNLVILQKKTLWSAEGLNYFLKRFRISAPQKDGVINLPAAKGVKVGGLTPTQIRLIVRSGELRGIDFYFANKGDAEPDENLKRRIRQQEEALKRVLTASFGQPHKSDSGSGKTRIVNNRRWNDANTVLLLKSEPGEYLVLHLLSRMEYDQQSSRKASRISANKADLAANVRSNDNGDAYIDGIPMVDQGAKGYCVPATMERILNYYKIPNVSMHRIADLAKSDGKKGTTIPILKKNLQPIMNEVGLKMIAKKLTMSSVKQSIDKGYPLLVTLYSTSDYLSQMEAVNKLHTEITNPVLRLKQTKKLKRVHRSAEGPHVCLIIGYNEIAKEVAVSNSWGEHFALTWVRLTDLVSVSLDGMMISVELR